MPSLCDIGTHEADVPHVLVFMLILVDVFLHEVHSCYVTRHCCQPRCESPVEARLLLKCIYSHEVSWSS